MKAQLKKKPLMNGRRLMLWYPHGYSSLYPNRFLNVYLILNLKLPMMLGHFLKKIFQDNKQSKTLELNVELRGLNIRDLTIEAYFRKIDQIATHLKKLGSTVKDPDLVMYAVTGLNDKYPHAAHIIIHRQPFPDLNTVRSMLTLEEIAANRKTNTSTVSLATPSNPTVLVTQTNIGSNLSSKQPQVCNNFSKGYCRFGERCRFLHPGHTRNNNSWSNNNNRLNNSLTQAQLLKIISSQQQQLLQQTHMRPMGLVSKPPLQSPNYGPLSYSTPRNQAQQQQSEYFTGFAGLNNMQTQASFLSGLPGFSSTRPLHPGPNVYNSTHGPQALYVGQPNTYSSFAVDPSTQTQETVLPNAFSSMTIQDYGAAGWHMDTGASSHLTSRINNLNTVFNHRRYSSVIVGDGNVIPVTNTGHSLLPSLHRPLHLNNTLVTPNIVKNLISVRQFTRDNKVPIEFDPFGFSVKDYLTCQLLLRCDSTGDLYPVASPTSQPTHQALLTSPVTWHQRFGHPGNDVFQKLISSKNIICNKMTSPMFCHACQLGKHVRLPFSVSSSSVNSVFDIIHSDLWTSPVSSLSGLKYYIIFLDHFSHYLWVFPLRHKSDAINKFIQFRTYIKTQFNHKIKAFL
ncbi:uncharacterized protein [Rutidosis leptorrhynchoides]|uniref:uncharacterized protein n=1 Tax=Rutidosis leptorrhynchoides TaxID=125765 RepID=UPI003A990A59